LKTLHITASYKPAYIYGGPIQSVAKLCEGILSFDSAQDDITQGDITHGDSNQNGKSRDGECGKNELEVLTTRANGKEELDVEVGKAHLIDGIKVTYFKRWTKDHSHFSPGLLWALRKKINQHTNPPSLTIPTHSPSSKRRQEPPRLTGTSPKEANELVIHIHAWWNLVSVLSCWVAKWYTVPVILSPRGMLNDYTQSNRNSFSKKVIHQFIGKGLLKYVHIHATSEQEKLEILKITTPKSIAVIPNLVDVKGINKRKVESLKLKAECAEPTLTFKLLFLSRIEEKKGLELLLEGLSTINFDYCLTIAGSGNENYIKSLKRKVESLKLGDRVKWIGQVGNEEKFKLMAEHGLLVLTSYNENFANVVIESLSVGTPVLISERVGLADYVAVNELGWICSLEPNDIAEKITEAYGAIAKRQKINSTAPFIIEKDFNEEALVGRYLEFYEDILHLSSEYLV